MAYTTIDNPELFFQCKLYTGTGSSHAITLDGSENMQPDMVWWKERTSTDYHTINDSVRGATKRIFTNATEAEDTNAESLKSFDSDGFTMGTNAGANQASQPYVAWNWKKTATAGFDIVSFTGNATGRTISHSLSAVPKMYIVKNRSAGSTQWRVYHASLGATKHMALDATQAVGTASSVFNNTEPTSSVFSVGTDTGANGNGNSLICYLFSEIKGYSKFGSYIGNGNADGTFVYTGFKPAYLLIKNINAGSENWALYDNKRDPINTVFNVSFPNSPNADGTNTSQNLDFLSNGFKCKSAEGRFNASGNTMIYMAFAESPFVNSNGIPNNAR